MDLSKQIKLKIKEALSEDLGSGDVTANSLVPENYRAKAYIEARQDGILAGLPVAEEVFKTLDSAVELVREKEDGSLLQKGDRVLLLSGPARSILSGERLALNLLMRLSGIATATGKFVAKAKPYGVKILDTRKTIPLWRELEKYAVRQGGGHNHRMGLYDQVLIKENHIQVVGTARKAVEKARAEVPSSIKIEVEVESVAQCEAVLPAQPDIILLDNMTPDEVKEAVELCRPHPKIELEVSGGVHLDNIDPYLKTGVHRISIGALTHSVTAFDFSLLVEEMAE